MELAPEKTSIGNYFDTNGYFYDDEFADEVQKLLDEFESKFEAVASPSPGATKPGAEAKKDK